ncbi:MAG: 50S ribosomal protein L22 [Alphaproteobacteria bacterium]|nr:50S ribosomal protein L22 [Alphaproteobacteria bacterium]
MEQNCVKAVNRMIRVSPQKINLVAKKIRGMKVDKALAYLKFSTKRISDDVYNTVYSAMSNAEHNHMKDIDLLYVKEAYVGQGLKMRRFRPRAKGRGAPIAKYFSHLTIVLEERVGA